MKKLMKKLSIIGLIVAMLVPFVELTTVSAAVEDCETHLQNYLFLDETYSIDINAKPEGKGKGKCDNIGGCIFGQYFEKDSTGSVPGYTTYALFPYKFSEINDNQYVKEVEVTYNDLSEETSLSAYWKLHNTVLNYSSFATNLSMQDPEQYGKTFVSRDNRNYKTDTILLHGKWKSTNSYNLGEISKWETISNIENSIQNRGIKNTSTNNIMEVSINGANYKNGSFEPNNSVSWTANPADYIKKILNGENASAIATEEGYKYISFEINRKLSEDALAGMTFGRKIKDADGNTKYEVFSSESTTTVAGAKNSYSAYKVNSEGTSKTAYSLTDAEDYMNLSFIEGETYYWPYVMNIEYTVCQNKSEKWTIKYDDNVNDTSVNNMPNPLEVSETVGTNIKLSADKPTRKDYTFKKWCDTANGSGTCYNPGDTVKSPDASKTITLFAQWGKTNTEENKKTGVMSYVIGFAAVGLVAGGIYLISKKKNLFKQI